MIDNGSDPGDDTPPDNKKSTSMATNNLSEYRGQLYPSPIAEWLYKFDDEFDERDPEVYKDEIGGLDSVLDKIQVFKNGITHRGLYSMMGITPPNGFILQGPPGYGKTYLAKYMAHNLDVRFIDLPLNQYESKWVGEAEKTLGHKLEKMLRYHRWTKQKVLLFMDEAEEALKDRSLEGWHGPRVNLLLRYMDGMGENNGIIYGAATNHIDKVDPAFLRAGRLDFIIEIKDYDSAQMADVFRATQVKYNRQAPHHEPFQLTTEDMKELGRKAKIRKLTPADINEVFRLAGEDKVRKMIELPEGQVLVLGDYTVVRDDLEKVIADYRRLGEKRIGF